MSIVGHNIWSIAWSVIFISVGLYICIVLIFFIFQSHLIFFPGRDINVTPDRIGLSYEVVYFEASDGVKLSGWFVPVENSRGVILFCHGNGGNISHRLESIQIFYNLGLSTFIFDYRGYGQSEGKITEQGTYLDAEAAWHYLVQKQKVYPKEIIIFGRSLGGSIAAWLAQAHTPKALIIESAFTSIQDIASELYPYLPVRLISRFYYDCMNYLRQVNCPILIVHSRDDETIPFNHGQRLFKTANEPKEFLEIAGTHNEGFITTAKHYEKDLGSFISKHVESEAL